MRDRVIDVLELEFKADGLGDDKMHGNKRVEELKLD